MDISRIRLLRSDVSIWLLYAGLGRRYFEIFQQTRSVFLSLPGFNASERVFQSDELIRRHLAMSEQVAKWIRGGRNSPPSRRPTDYNPYPYASGSREAKSFGAELGNIYRLFVEAKPGDLILSPPYGHYDPFLIGEITHNWRKEDDLDVSVLERETVPARKVRWLNTAVARRDFPARVSRRLQNQHAITKLDSDFYEEIFDLVYPSYAWGDKSKLDIFGDNYKGTDPLQTYASALLIKYVVASVFAFKSDQFSEFQTLSPQDAIDRFYDENQIEDFGQNFNSPGKFSITAALGSLAILASAGLVVATADSGVPFQQTQQQASDQVKDALKGAGKADAERELDDYIGSMDAMNWSEIQRELGSRSNSTLPISLDNRTEIAQHRAELNAR